MVREKQRLIIYTALQNQSAVTTYLVKIDISVQMGLRTTPLSCEIISWFKVVPLQRNVAVKTAVTTKSCAVLNFKAIFLSSSVSVVTVLLLYRAEVV